MVINTIHKIVKLTFIIWIIFGITNFLNITNIDMSLFNLFYHGIILWIFLNIAVKLNIYIPPVIF